MNSFENRLKAKLAPESVSQTLIRAGCFLSAYELIKAEIVDNVRSFYSVGFNESGPIYDEEAYQEKVLARNSRSKYRASCSWLINMGALSEKDVDILEEVQEHRHEIAHELPRLLIDPDLEVRTDLLVSLIECVRKLGAFWGGIEVDTNPDWDNEEVDYDNIKSGPYLLMEYLASIAALGPNVPDAKEPGL